MRRATACKNNNNNKREPPKVSLLRALKFSINRQTKLNKNSTRAVYGTKTTSSFITMLTSCPHQTLFCLSKYSCTRVAFAAIWPAKAVAEDHCPGVAVRRQATGRRDVGGVQEAENADRVDRMALGEVVAYPGRDSWDHCHWSDSWRHLLVQRSSQTTRGRLSL